MTDVRFSPFETVLDPGRALAILREAVAGGDDGELFLERRRSEALMFDDGRLRTASYDASEGFGLRAIRGEVSGYAHATEISEAAPPAFDLLFWNADSTRLPAAMLLWYLEKIYIENGLRQPGQITLDGT